MCTREMKAFQPVQEIGEGNHTTPSEFRPLPLNTNMSLNSVPIKVHLSFDYVQQVRKCTLQQY